MKLLSLLNHLKVSLQTLNWSFFLWTTHQPIRRAAGVIKLSLPFILGAFPLTHLCPDSVSLLMWCRILMELSTGLYFHHTESRDSSLLVLGYWMSNICCPKEWEHTVSQVFLRLSLYCVFGTCFFSYPLFVMFYLIDAKKTRSRGPWCHFPLLLSCCV